MKNILFIDGQVGVEICSWMISNYIEDIGLIVMNSESAIIDKAKASDLQYFIYRTEDQLLEFIDKLGLHYDWGFLIWWPHIISDNVIEIASHGFINTHPSLLPFGRGKHSNFWSIVEQTPFGVSLHFVGRKIDGGDIITQQTIDYDWEDNGETLYKKALNAMVALFKESYPQIRKGDVSRVPQNLNEGTQHYSDELERASYIELDSKFTAKELINLLRARTFTGYPACWFSENGNDYEVRIDIKRKKK